MGAALALCLLVLLGSSATRNGQPSPFAEGFLSPSSHSSGVGGTATDSSSRLSNNEPNDETYIAQEDQQSRKSVADYTLGLHGGKYQFDENSASPLNSMGQSFAESLYGTTTENNVNKGLEKEPLPQWAVRLSQTNVADISRQGKVVLTQDDQTAGTWKGDMVVTNDEMTWERFYAFIVHSASSHSASTNSETNQQLGLTVSPSCGMLERRGGQARLYIEAAPISENQGTTKASSSSTKSDHSNTSGWSRGDGLLDCCGHRRRYLGLSSHFGIGGLVFLVLHILHDLEPSSLDLI